MISLLVPKKQPWKRKKNEESQNDGNEHPKELLAAYSVDSFQKQVPRWWTLLFSKSASCFLMFSFLNLLSLGRKTAAGRRMKRSNEREAKDFAFKRFWSQRKRHPGRPPFYRYILMPRWEGVAGVDGGGQTTWSKRQKVEPDFTCFSLEGLRSWEVKQTLVRPPKHETRTPTVRWRSCKHLER